MLSRAAGLLALALLTGCADGALPSLSGEPQSTMSLFGGSVIVTGPEGFCVDPRASQPRSGFVIFANCGVLGGETTVSSGAVITLTVGNAGTALVAGNEDALGTLLRSSAESLLGAGGAVQEIESRAGVVEALVEATPPAALGALEPTHWRGFVDLRGRLVTIAVYGIEAAPLSVDRGKTLLNQTVVRLGVANSG